MVDSLTGGTLVVVGGAAAPIVRESNAPRPMWDEIQDMPGEIFDFDGWVEQIASDPEFIAQVEASNAQFDAEVGQLP